MNAYRLPSHSPFVLCSRMCHFIRSGNSRFRLRLAFATTVLCLLLVLRSKYELTVVIGESMRPTLGPGDLLVVDKRAYRVKEPVRGDIIVARYRKEWVVKRIVALPGEEVQIRRGNLYIDGIFTPENHPIEPGSLDLDKGTLMMRRFATLGDNRNVPRDQVIHPIVSKENIMGKVVFSLTL